MDKSLVVHDYILMPSRAFVLSSYTDLYARLNCRAAHTYNRPRDLNSPEPSAAKLEGRAYVSMMWLLAIVGSKEELKGTGYIIPSMCERGKL
jgi:hypothetical protein